MVGEISNERLWENECFCTVGMYDANQFPLGTTRQAEEVRDITGQHSCAATQEHEADLGGWRVEFLVQLRTGLVLLAFWWPQGLGRVHVGDPLESNLVAWDAEGLSFCSSTGPWTEPNCLSKIVQPPPKMVHRCWTSRERLGTVFMRLKQNLGPCGAWRGALASHRSSATGRARGVNILSFLRQNPGPDRAAEVRKH